MSYIKAHYHPILFVLMSTCAVAEVGLTAFLIEAGNEHHTWPGARYHSLYVVVLTKLLHLLRTNLVYSLILFLFNGIWTMLFAMAYVFWIVGGAVHLLASIASSIIWLLITTILWGIASGLMRNTRHGSNCPNAPAISRCRQSLTVEALGWTEFSLCLLTLLATCLWLRTGKRNYRSSYYVDQDWA